MPSLDSDMCFTLVHISAQRRKFHWKYLASSPALARRTAPPGSVAWCIGPLVAFPMEAAGCLWPHLGQHLPNHVPSCVNRWFSSHYLNQIFLGACVLSRFNRVRLFETLRTGALQAPLSTGFSRQEYWSGLPCPPPGDLPHPGTEPLSLTSSLALAGGFFTTSTTWEASFLGDVWSNETQQLSL